MGMKMGATKRIEAILALSAVAIWAVRPTIFVRSKPISDKSCVFIFPTPFLPGPPGAVGEPLHPPPVGMEIGATRRFDATSAFFGHSRLRRFARQFSYDQSQFPISHVFSYSPRRSWRVQPELVGEPLHPPPVGMEIGATRRFDATSAFFGHSRLGRFARHFLTIKANFR